MANSPTGGTAIFDGQAANIEQFHKVIILALEILAGFQGLALIVSIAALGVQLVRKDQRRIVKTASRPEGTYFLPHSPVLAPAMVTCFCILALATCFVLKAFLSKGSQTPVIQRLSLLLPLPLLLWAWFSAFSNAFAWHLTPAGSSKRFNRLRLPPLMLNIVCWATPLLFTGAEMAIVNVWPSFQARASAFCKLRDALEEQVPSDDSHLLSVSKNCSGATARAAVYYQASWGIWAIAYAACWIVYACYASLLLAMMDRQRANVATATLETKEAPSIYISTEGDVTDESAHRPSLCRRASLLLRRCSTGAWEFAHWDTTVSKARYITKRELLRRNMRLVALEFAAFSLFTLLWVALASGKAIMGYRILNNHTTGPITIVGEIVESTIFGLIVVVLLLGRGVNVLKNRGRSPATPVLPAAFEHDSGSRDAEQGSTNSQTLLQALARPQTVTTRSGEGSLAARRGAQNLSIPLTLGNLVMPSAVNTPVQGLGLRADKPHPTLSYFGHVPGTGSSSLDYGSTLCGTPVSVKLVDDAVMPTLPPQVRRKSSITFADGLPGGLSEGTLLRTTSLEAIEASPLIPDSSNPV